jgi:hypothetical protein
VRSNAAGVLRVVSLHQLAHFIRDRIGREARRRGRGGVPRQALRFSASKLSFPPTGLPRSMSMPVSFRTSR